MLSNFVWKQASNPWNWNRFYSTDIMFIIYFAYVCVIYFYLLASGFDPIHKQETSAFIFKKQHWIIHIILLSIAWARNYNLCVARLCAMCLLHLDVAQANFNTLWLLKYYPDIPMTTSDVLVLFLLCGQQVFSNVSFVPRCKAI